MAHAQSYEAILAASERVSFRLDEILPEQARFDFGSAFLPESLARTSQLPFLSDAERLQLNQLRAATYLGMFGLVEEFILPFVLDQVRQELAPDDLRTRALLAFAGEEAKHIQLFKRFRACFDRQFQSPHALIGPGTEIGRAVLSRAPLAVALLVLHIEWMTQRHYIESVRDDSALEPRFKSLLKAHWLEEAQHAKLDAHLTRELASKLDARAREEAVDEYLLLVDTFDTLLAQQAEFDIQAFERVSRRVLDRDERAALLQQQHQANRWTYLGSGMTHPQFVSTLASVEVHGAARVAAVTRKYC
jgi:hypothetical protein